MLVHVPSPKSCDEAQTASTSGNWESSALNCSAFSKPAFTRSGNLLLPGVRGTFNCNTASCSLLNPRFLFCKSQSCLRINNVLEMRKIERTSCTPTNIFRNPSLLLGSKFPFNMEIGLNPDKIKAG